ncbi:Multidrug resistance protein MdtA precursor [compost metagenome]
MDLTLPERDLASVRRYQAQGPLKVTAVGTDGGPSTTGTLAILDNAVDPSTATFRARARFSNAQHSLWPGQFARVELTLATQNDARVVPNAAIQTGQSGPFVYLVKPDQTVEMRPVKVDRQVGDVTVVADGLAPGERVVTDGQFQLTPGTTVRIDDNRRVARQ